MNRPAPAAPCFEAVVPAPFGAVGIVIAGSAVESLHFLPPGTSPIVPRGALARRAAQQLDAFFCDPQARFDLPLRPRGTAFQHRVWQAIAGIAPGRTRRYGELASELGSAARAVGQACGANPLPLVVPCHRVVAATGIGGFAHAADGYLLATKRWLLAHEAAVRA